MFKTRKHIKHVNEKDFDLIKFLLDKNISNSKIKELSSRGDTVLRAVKKKNTFAEYRKYVNDLGLKQKEAKLHTPDIVEKEPEQLPLSVNTTAFIIGKLNSILRALQLINDRLDEIEKQNTEKQEKSRFWNK